MNEMEYKPYYCVWELTLKCNMNCLHCGSKAGKARDNELTYPEAMVVAEELINLGCKQISLIGGEVFLYHNWEKIARVFTDSGVQTNLITNGFLFSDKQLNEVKYANLSNIAISIDGMEANHNRIRGNNKSFSKIKNTINILNKENIKIGVNTTLINSNVNDLEDLYSFLVTNNVAMWQLQLANPMGNLAEKSEEIISIENIKSITKFIHRLRDENKIKIYTGDNIGYYDEHESYIRGLPGNINYWSGCQAGLSVIGIDSVGNVKGCESLYDDIFIEGNVREESLSEIWNKEGNFVYNRDFRKELLTGKCSTCDMGVFCKAGCRGACYFTKNSFFENAYCIYNS